VIARDRKSNTYHGGTETRRKRKNVCRRSAQMNADQEKLTAEMPRRGEEGYDQVRSRVIGRSGDRKTNLPPRRGPVIGALRVNALENHRETPRS
jgi:hypothetical protein